jgi:hypothetical protein
MVNAIKSACKTAGVSEKIRFFPIGSGGHTIWSGIGKNGTYAKWLFEAKMETSEQ